ncbi:MAG: chemotaxis protein CheX [bacterium]
MVLEKANLYKALTQAVAESLESLAFVEAILLDEKTPLLPEEQAPKPRTSVAWARTPFIKPLEGEILLIMPPELGQMLTEIIFGAMGEEKISDEVMLDAIAETSNVVAGRVMNGLIGNHTEFELGLPIRGMGSSDQEVPMPRGTLHKLDYTIEGYTFTVILGAKGFEQDRNSK